MRCIAIILSAVLLVGCVHYKASPIDPVQSVQDLQARSLRSPGLKEFLEKNLDRPLNEWPVQVWDFEQLALAAYYFHPDLEVARAQWRTAEAATLTAGGRPNPTVTMVPGFNSDSLSGVSPWMPALTFDVPIETAHKREFRMALAQNLAQSSRFRITTAAWQVRSHLRSSLLDLLAAERKLELLRKLQLGQEQMLKALKQSADAGAIAESEVRPAQLAASKVAFEVLDIQRQTKQARAQLAEAIGVSSASIDNIRFTWAPETKAINPSALKQMRQTALKNRADILAALSDYAAAESALQLEVVKQYPDVHISPNYQWDQGENKWALGITVELPVLNRNQGGIAEAKARREESAVKFLALQARVLAEIDLALTGYQASRAQLNSMDQWIATHREQLKSIQAQQQAGAVTQLEVFTVRAELNAAEVNRWESEIKMRQAIGALEDALQMPLLSGLGIDETKVSSLRGVGMPSGIKNSVKQNPKSN